MTVLEDLGKFLLAEIAVGLGKESLDPDEDLLEQRIIDSMAILKLVLFMEQTFGIEVKDEDIVPENFQSLNSTVRFVEQKMQNK
jgi:acyl carrier protein